MTSPSAGPMWKGSGVSAPGRSAWRRAASATTPWAVMAARARFIESFSSPSRWAVLKNSKPPTTVEASKAATLSGGVTGGGAGAAFALPGEGALALAAAFLGGAAALEGAATAAFRPLAFGPLAFGASFMSISPRGAKPAVEAGRFPPSATSRLAVEPLTQ